MRTIHSVILLGLLAAPVAGQSPVPNPIATAEAPPEHQGSQAVQAPADDGTFTLHAKDATVHGSTVRYEPAPEKNTIGYWTKLEDWVSWSFDVPKPGKFAIEVLQGCGKGQGGSDVEISVGDQKLIFTVEDTGHFQNFVLRKIGTASLSPGRNTIAVRAKTRKAAAVMDLRQIVLRPLR